MRHVSHLPPKLSHLSHFKKSTPTHLPQNRILLNPQKSSQHTILIWHLTRRHRHVKTLAQRGFLRCHVTRSPKRLSRFTWLPMRGFTWHGPFRANLENSMETINERRSWYVYILRCNDESLYTGISTNVEERVKRHNDGKGAAYTRSHRPVVLIWREKTDSESAARKREAEIKGWTKLMKENLVG